MSAMLSYLCSHFSNRYHLKNERLPPENSKDNIHIIVVGSDDSEFIGELMIFGLPSRNVRLK